MRYSSTTEPELVTCLHDRGTAIYPHAHIQQQPFKNPSVVVPRPTISSSGRAALAATAWLVVPTSLQMCISRCKRPWICSNRALHRPLILPASKPWCKLPNKSRQMRQKVSSLQGFTLLTSSPINLVTTTNAYCKPDLLSDKSCTWGVVSRAPSDNLACRLCEGQ